jgi:hypothetical protein
LDTRSPSDGVPPTRAASPRDTRQLCGTGVHAKDEDDGSSPQHARSKTEVSGWHADGTARAHVVDRATRRARDSSARHMLARCERASRSKASPEDRAEKAGRCHRGE